MGGGLMQLALMAQDIYLTGNPQITFSSSTSPHKFLDGSHRANIQRFADFGKRVTCTVSP